MTRNAVSHVDLYFGDLLNGTSEMPPETFNVYVRILLWYWEKGGRLRDDDQWLAAMCRLSTRKYRVIKNCLIEEGRIKLVKIGNDTFIENKRAKESLNNAQTIKDKFSKSQSKRAEKRWKKDEQTAEDQQSCDAAGNADGNAAIDATAYAYPTPTPFTLTNVSDAEAPDLLWSKGLELVQNLTGFKSDKSCRSFVGKMLKLSSNNYRKVLDAIEATYSYREMNGGIADASSYMLACLEQKVKPQEFDATNTDHWKAFFGDADSKWRPDHLRYNWPLKHGPNPWEKANDKIPKAIYDIYAEKWGWVKGERNGHDRA